MLNLTPSKNSGRGPSARREAKGFEPPLLGIGVHLVDKVGTGEIGQRLTTDRFSLVRLTRKGSTSWFTLAGSIRTTTL